MNIQPFSSALMLLIATLSHVETSLFSNDSRPFAFSTWEETQLPASLLNSEEEACPFETSSLSFMRR
jgi:hypothetical protein